MISYTTHWWWGEDLNLRRLSRQIYSLIPLTTREPHRYILEPIPRIERRTFSLQVRCSTNWAISAHLKKPQSKSRQKDREIISEHHKIINSKFQTFLILQIKISVLLPYFLLFTSIISLFPWIKPISTFRHFLYLNDSYEIGKLKFNNLLMYINFTKSTSVFSTHSFFKPRWD